VYDGGGESCFHGRNVTGLKAQGSSPCTRLSGHCRETKMGLNLVDAVGIELSTECIFNNMLVSG